MRREALHLKGSCSDLSQTLHVLVLLPWLHRLTLHDHLDQAFDIKIEMNHVVYINNLAYHAAFC